MNNTISLILEAFQYDFILKAMVVGGLIALCCAFLGTFLVLKKFSMIGDGLAHVSFASVAIALFFSVSPLLVSIPMVIVASFAILKLSESDSLHGDAAIGLVSAFSIAIGVMISSLAQGFNVDLMSYLFGSILVISDFDVMVTIVFAIIVIVAVILNYHNLFAITYDEEFAQVNGVNAKKMNYLLAVLTSITIALGIRVVGTLLISSLIVFPTVSALQVSSGFKTTIIIASVISVMCVFLGVLLSFVLDFPTGATIVVMNSICFAFSYLTKKLRNV